MNRMQFFDLVTVEFQTYKCNYCYADLTDRETERVDVTNLQGHWLYSYCQTDKCMTMHLHNLYKDFPGYICYNNGCMQ